MLLAENQVLQRNIDHLPPGEVLLLDALPDQALKEFGQQRPDIRWSSYTPFADTYHALTAIANQASQPVLFGPWLEGEVKYDAIVIYYPKTKLRFDYYLSFATKLLKADGMLYVVGEKKGGIKSCDKALSSFAIRPYKLDAARHCLMYAAAFNGSACPRLFDDWFSTTSIDVEVAGQNVHLDLKALPGVFSANRLDDGSALLLKTMELVKGIGLDFGCGCGVLAAALAKRFHVNMTGSDVDALAVASSNKTFESNQVSAKAICSDGLSALLSQNMRFDFIATNPPFHTGIKTDYGITESFIRQLPKIIHKDYQVWMVANAFLPYPELFKRHLKAVEIKSKNNRFNIYHTGSSIKA